MKKNLQRGFTLIELLVVIAIIGILASVVLASLNSARNKGADAAIKSQLANLRAEAEIFYDGHNSTYGTAFNPAAACNTAGAGTMFNDDASFKTATANLNTTAGSQPTCASTTSSWAMSSALKTPSAGNYCVDSTGASKSGTAAIVAGAAVCQ